ncbi:hypothetical protein MLD52_12280 [Puniceicoccaceae bacterium K14]|nr:hypothetical protein [Puniceicoccaceae bacterium K14]
MLTVTDSDTTVSRLTTSEREGEFLAWADRLHMGRVTPTADITQFSADRADVYRSFGWDEDLAIKEDFNLRNSALQEALEAKEEVRLLFGRSLGDQLKLAQLCFWLSLSDTDCLDRVFLKVGQNDDDLLRDEGFEKPSVEELESYRSFWIAFASKDPRFLLGTLKSSNAVLAKAAERLLQEYPSSENGLSLAEAQILDAVALGISRPQELFDAFQETEENPYLLNWDFWAYLDRLCVRKSPLIECANGDDFLCPPKDLAWDDFYAQQLRLTVDGKNVLEGKTSYTELHFGERWVGGCLLKRESVWYWDYASKTLVRELCVPELTR